VSFKRQLTSVAALAASTAGSLDADFLAGILIVPADGNP
jgi:hypothetical protein